MLDKAFKSNHMKNIQRENHHRIPIDSTHESCNSIKSLIPQKPTNELFPGWAIRNDNSQIDL